MRSPHRLVLLAILATQVALGTQYALRTPLWQAPDEPAHYNYVAQISDGTPDPPEMAPGDYPYADLERLKADGFPADRSIASIAYEDYQPPAYYYLAAVVVAAVAAEGDERGGGGGDGLRREVFALRRFGVLIGTITVLLAWLAARLACPGDEAVATASAVFVAFLPMHLAVTASVSNEPLAYAVSAAIVCAALARTSGSLAGRPAVVAQGLLVGLALLTKVSVYPLVALLAAGELLAARRGGAAAVHAAVRRTAALLAVGLALAAPWFVRNMVVYGPADPLGTRMHDLVVFGQPRTADWIAAQGPGGWLSRLVTFSFESFWGVFGWMGVFLDPRVYVVLAGVTACAAVGLLGFVVGAGRSGEASADVRRGALAVLALAVALSLGVFLTYNLRFVQHQGRYLFPALAPIAVLFVLGLRQVGTWVGGTVGTGRAVRYAAVGAMYGFTLALGVLAWVALTRYVVPGLS